MLYYQINFMVQEFVKKFYGKGTFDFFYLDEKIEQEFGFSLVQYSNAEIEIECYPIESSFKTQKNTLELFNTSANNIDIYASINGEVYPIEKVNPAGKIQVETAYLNVVNFNFNNGLATFKFKLKIFNPVEIFFSDIHSEEGNITAFAGLTNFIFEGCQTIVNPRDFTKVELEDFIVYFIKNENYEDIKELLDKEKEDILVTSEVMVEYSKNNAINFSKIAENLSDLLSYSNQNRISHIYEDYYINDNYLKTILRPVFTKKFFKKKELINLNYYPDKCNLKIYLESCYENYLKSLEIFAFDIIISFYLESITHNYVDISFLLGTTTLETLLAGYAEMRKEKGDPIIVSTQKQNKKEILKLLRDNSTENANEIADKIIDKISYPYPSVNDKLTNLIKDERYFLKLGKYDRDFMNIRNKIAHTGKFPKTIKSSGIERNLSEIEERNRLLHLLDMIILKILNYTDKPFFNKLNNEIDKLN